MQPAVINIFEKAVKRGKYKIAKFKIEDEQAPKL